MVFTQAVFFLFLLITFAIYWSLGSNTIRKAFLLLASSFFYGWWDWRFLLLLYLTVAVDFFAALFIAGGSSFGSRRFWLMLSLAANLAVLAFFKYFNFFLSSFHDLLAIVGISSPHLAFDIILPVGISFYTFQSMSYTIDVYLDRLRPTKSFLDFALSVLFFPQLVAGPIMRAGFLLPQMREKRIAGSFRLRNLLMLFLIGYMKKACLADNIAAVIDPVFDSPGIFSSSALAMASVLYTLQIYCDFSGYSDMALATAGLFGYELCENFRFPLLSTNIRDFWRRWHMSLSSWLRDYLYIPLGGSAASQFRTYRNTLIVMLLCGLWHGAAYTFVVWGACHAGALIASRVWNEYMNTSASKRPAADVACWFLTISFVVLTFVIFRSPSMSAALAYFRGMFAFSGNGRQLPAALLLITTALLMIHLLVFKFGESAKRQWQLMPAELAAAAYGTGVALALYLTPINTAPFIYFQF